MKETDDGIISLSAEIGNSIALLLEGLKTYGRGESPGSKVRGKIARLNGDLKLLRILHGKFHDQLEEVITKENTDRK